MNALIPFRNLLLTENDTVKICDMGVSTKFTKETIYTFNFHGTIPYVSPELLECFFHSDAKYMPNTDIWYNMQQFLICF